MAHAITCILARRLCSQFLPLHSACFSTSAFHHASASFTGSQDKEAAKLRKELERLEIGPITRSPAGSNKETHIPLTKSSLIRFLSKEKGMLSESDQQGFDAFAEALDNSLVNRYYGTLKELKDLFEPLNPDDSRIKSREWSRRERLDSEFWFMQRLSNLMRLCNFTELTKVDLEDIFVSKVSRYGVVVDVDIKKYDVLKIWVMGKQVRTNHHSFLKRLWLNLLGNVELPEYTYFHRVLAAVRVKSDDRLALKMFKDVERNSLEMLLPEGNILMSKMDKMVLSTSISMGFLGLIYEAYAWLLQYPYFAWPMALVVLSLLVSVRAYVVYKDRKTGYLLRLNEILYYKNLASNLGLLPILTDRAEEETFKEALLCYTFLLNDYAEKQVDPANMKGMSQVLLEQRIQEWVKERCVTSVNFDSDAAISILKSLGLVTASEGSEEQKNLIPLPISQALAQLPRRPHFSNLLLSDQSSEGYEKDRYSLIIDLERRSGWQ